MDLVRIINFTTVTLLSITIYLLFLLWDYFSSSPEVAIKINSLTGLVTGLMVIAILLQIFSTNRQLRRIIPSIKIVDSYLEYKLLDLDKGGIRISRMDIFLNLFNESEVPVYINTYKLDIGRFDPLYYSKNFELKEDDKIEFHNVLFVPPNEMKKVHIVEDWGKYPYNSFIVRSIESVNNAKLKDIHAAEIRLFGNFGVQKGKIGFYLSREPRPN